MTGKPRWQYRFDNYSRAFKLLREAIELIERRPLTQLEKEGVIQRFEYTWELAWKTLKDYLEYKGVVLETITPSEVIKSAFSSKIIGNGDVWMEALDSRNKMSHTYDLRVFEETVSEIKKKYLAVFDDLYMTLLEKSADNK